MTISQHANTFAGYPVVDWNREDDIFANGTEIAVAIRTDWNENQKDNNVWITKFEALLQREPTRQLPALVVGMWHWEKTVKHIVEALVANRARLPKLKALFVGDITYEEFEISWIKQGDLAPLWAAFPDLEHLTIRGGDGLKIDPLHLPKLKSLRIETGGLRREVVRSVGEAKLPELESLVLWLGTDEYGATTTIADLAPFYECATMPKLKYLGLCNSDIQDAVAEFMATAPVLQRLEVLDLSMGTLTDEGALALLTSPYIRHLKKLDLHHHYCSDGMLEKLRELAKDGLKVNVADQQSDDEDGVFVAVGE